MFATHHSRRSTPPPSAFSSPELFNIQLSTLNESLDPVRRFCSSSRVTSHKSRVTNCLLFNWLRTLPSSVSSKSFVCHSLVPSGAEGYENCRVTSFKPNILHFPSDCSTFRSKVRRPSGAEIPTWSGPVTTALSPLAATLMGRLVSVVDTGLTRMLSHLDATLTQNRGRGCSYC